MTRERRGSAPRTRGRRQCLLHLRFARPPRGGRGGRAGDMGDPHICEKNVGRKPDEAAFGEGRGERGGGGGPPPPKPAAGGLPCGPYPGFFAGLGRGRKGLAGAGWGSGFWGELEAGREICADRAGKAGKTRGRQMTQRRRNAMGGICLL